MWLEGRVVRSMWASADGGYAVIRVATAEGETVVVGPVATVAEMADEQPFATFEGEWHTHPSHGHQFKATAVLLGSPRTAQGLELYLASSGVPGVGPKLAKQLVAHFGDEALAVLEHQPERLTEVAGIGPVRAETIADAWAADAEGRALSILLRGLGLSGRLVERVRQRYGDDAYRVVTGEPYRLAEDVRGIGFLTADQMARAQGVAEDAPERVAAAVVHLVQRAGEDGHVVTPVSELQRGLEGLRVPSGGLDVAVAEVIAEGRVREVVYAGEPALVRPRLDDAELSVAAHLANRVDPIPLDDLDIRLADAERYAGLTLDESQREAVRMAVTHGASVITGGPGTGKTTLVKVLLRLGRERGETWLLASPTGRAAKRLSEATGSEAMTIHRLLGFAPDGGFARSATEPLEADGLVVDETSMVDLKLMAALVDALPYERPFRVVFVGDADQLPSVGAGQVLRDLVDSGVLPTARLRTVHRQAARSGIRVGAAALRDGQVPTSGEGAAYDDLFLLKRDDPRHVIDTVRTVVTERLPAKGFDPFDDVLVLTPMHKGPLGVDAVGGALREALQGDAPRIKVGFREYSLGDKVLCTRNRYDLDVFNGDVGRVTAVASDGLTIRFDDRDVVWSRDDLDQITLAYAMTVHKAQGSESPAVVLVLHSSHAIMLQRHLFYTAMTRAKRFLCVVGNQRAWEMAARRVDGAMRRTLLAERLTEAVRFR